MPNDKPGTDLAYRCFTCKRPVPFTVTICDECESAPHAVPTDTPVVVTSELLSQLLEGARAAGPKNWAVWVNTHGDPVVVPVGEKGFLRICDTSKAPADYGRANNAHIAGADPATVEALVDHIATLTAQLEAATAPARELEAAALERFADQWDSKLWAAEVLEPWTNSMESHQMRAEAERIRAGGETPCTA